MSTVTSAVHLCQQNIQLFGSAVCSQADSYCCSSQGMKAIAFCASAKLLSIDVLIWVIVMTVCCRMSVTFSKVYNWRKACIANSCVLPHVSAPPSHVRPVMDLASHAIPVPCRPLYLLIL